MACTQFAMRASPLVMADDTRSAALTARIPARKEKDERHVKTEANNVQFALRVTIKDRNSGTLANRLGEFFIPVCYPLLPAVFISMASGSSQQGGKGGVPWKQLTDAAKSKEDDDQIGKVFNVTYICMI